MKPYIHATHSVRKFGGKIQDYIEIHNFFDISKFAFPDMRHRAILHNSLGCLIVEKIFGYPYEKMEEYSQKFNWSEEECQAVIELIELARTNSSTSIRNSDGKMVQVRDIAEQHILEDLGHIPTVQDWLKDLPIYDWANGSKNKVREIILEKIKNI